MESLAEIDESTVLESPSPALALPPVLAVCGKAYFMDRVLVENDALLEALKILGIEATVYDENTQNWATDIDFKISILIFNDFSGPLFDTLRKKYHSRIYGAPVLIEAAELRESKLPITRSRYPIYCRLLKNCKISVTGVTSRETLHSLHRYILYMDGMYLEKEGVVTHLLANRCTGSKYRDAVALGRPVLKIDWIYEIWKQRDNYKLNCCAISNQFKLPVFHGLKIVFQGFDEPEKLKMIRLAEDNGGNVVDLDDPTATHIVKGLSRNFQDSLLLTPVRSTAAPTLAEEKNLMKPSPLKRPRFELQVLNDLIEEESQEQEDQESTCTTDDVELQLPNQKALVLKSEWFWSSIQIDACADEQMYLMDPPVEETVNCSIGTMSFSSPMGILTLSDQETPKSECVLLSGGRRKRKRAQQFGQIDTPDRPDFSSNLFNFGGDTTISSINSSKIIDKRKEILDSEFAVCLKELNEFLSNPDYAAMTMRHREYAHLLETERNYVSILHNIVKNFKEPCEKEDQVGGRVLDVSEVREIFGDILPIYSLHRHLLYDLARLQQSWSEESLIGKVFCDYESEFKKAYKQFVNYFEDCKAAISRLEKEKPRFLAVIRIAQGRAECGKQSLSDLMIRPVQRLPSTALILERLKKHTGESNPDYEWTSKALEVIQQANQNINEEKKRNEVLHAIYELDMKVDGLPPLVVSSHRQIEAVLDVQSVTEAYGQKFESITLFVFNDKLMIVKRRNNVLNKNHLTGTSSVANLRSPAMSRKSIAVNLPTHSKPYKFLELIPYESVRRVIDVKDGISSFGFVVRDEEGMRDRTIAFTTPDDPKWSNKSKLLELFVDLTTKAGQDERTKPVCMTQQELKPRSSESTTVLEKASKFATKTRHKVTRALSLSRTPNKLRRTMSQMMSPSTKFFN